MKVYGCQVDTVWENRSATLAKVRELLGGTPIEPGSLVVLPEMFSTGFSMNVGAIRESLPPETEKFLMEMARTYRAYFVGGLVTLSWDGRGKNEAVVINPEGELITRYCKMHPFTFGGESQHYAPGSEIVTFQWHEFVVAPFICYDLRFPEVFRSAVRRGAEMFVVIANWPSKRVQHWLALLKARAIENQAYVVGVNRVGEDPKLAYPGRSVVIDPKGEVIAEGGDHETIVSAAVSLEAVTDWRREFPALQDIHAEFVK